MTTTHEPKTINGIPTQQMFATVDAIQTNPALARFEFRNRNRWIQGGENRSTIQDFYGAGREDDSRAQPFVFTSGEAPVLLGANEGANPVEFLLHALAGCVTTTTVLHAAARGITIQSMQTRVIGQLDLRGLLGLSEDVSPGCEQITFELDVKADCSPEELDDLLAFVQGHSPVATMVRQPVPVSFVRADLGA